MSDAPDSPPPARAPSHAPEPAAAPPNAAPRPPIPFSPVPLRERRDGWSAERQQAFIEALAECGCVREACARVGRSPESAYRLQRRPGSQSFRLAWEAALDFSIRRIEEGAFSRAMNGVVVPHYYQGERVGEHRRYDERLAMFLLRCRNPARYGAAAEQPTAASLPEAVALRLGRAIDGAVNQALLETLGHARWYFDALPEDGDEDTAAFARRHYVAEPPEEEDEDAEAEAPQAEGLEGFEDLDEADPTAPTAGERSCPPDRASTSSTSEGLP